MHLLEWAKSETLAIPNASEDVEQQKLSIHCWLGWKMIQPLWKKVGQFLKT